MKKSIYLIAALLSMLLCAKFANAQNEVIVGSNLNVGTDNTIGDNVNCGNVMGLQNTIYGNCSLTTGSFNYLYSSGICSGIFGDHNILSGMNGFIVGSSNITASDYSMAFGENLSVSGNNSILFGKGYRNSQGAYQLENTINYSFMVGFNSTRPTFLVFGPRNVGDVNDMTGKIAIGDVSGEELSETDAKMIIRSDEGEDAGIILEPKTLGSSNTFIQLRDQGHRISVNKDGVMQLNCKNDNENAPMMINGIVGINVANVNKLKPGYSLYVDGNVMAEKVSIKSYSQWPDFVFGQDYRLMPLGELKQYVSENSHLPEVPTEAEVSESGIDVAEMQGILLKKIEELTLYTIQLQEQIERQQKEIDELKMK